MGEFVNNKNILEEETISYILENKDLIIETSKDQILKKDNGKSLDESLDGYKIDGVYKNDNTIVQFSGKGVGIAPSSKYSGFYYSLGNSPASFQNGDSKLEEISKDKWQWEDEGNGVLPKE